MAKHKGDPPFCYKAPPHQACRRISLTFLPIAFLLLFAVNAGGQTAPDPCPRPEAGAVATNPPELRSKNGVLELSLHLKYQQTMIGQGPPRYCYVTDDGLESPTLRVVPGDKLIIHLHNDLPPWRAYGASTSAHPMPAQQDDCHATKMDPSFTNFHFHGMTIPPVCHQDDVIHTAIPAGGEFEYSVTIPGDEPPGLYWYHPHPHGYGERQVQGGASGAIIVEGLEKAVPSVKGLPERVLVLRDQQRIGTEPSIADVPAWDISANFVPITYAKGQPANIETRPGEKELWRVVNAGADVIFNLQLLINNQAQPLQMVAIDGVPVSSAKPLPPQTTLPLPPGARAEFVISTPKEGENGQLITQAWDTGPQGDNDTKRTIANVVSTPSSKALNSSESAPHTSWSPETDGSRAIVHRRLYFSQQSSNSQDPDGFVLYYVTVSGQSPKTYEMGEPPNIVVHQGDVEDWTVENQAPEDHVFHIHQIHFRVLAINGKPVNDPTPRDTIDVPYWSGDGPYPSVKLRMDFRDPNIVGTFLYHCHILKHEDMGMMGSVQVLPPGVPTAVRLTASRQKVLAGDPVVVVGSVEPRAATGTIQFSVDGRDTGKPVPISEGKATLNTSFGEPGRHTITATYSGDTTYDQSASQAFEMRVRE